MLRAVTGVNMARPVFEEQALPPGRLRTRVGLQPWLLQCRVSCNVKHFCSTMQQRLSWVCGRPWFQTWPPSAGDLGPEEGCPRCGGRVHAAEGVAAAGATFHRFVFSSYLYVYLYLCLYLWLQGQLSTSLATPVAPLSTHWHCVSSQINDVFWQVVPLMRPVQQTYWSWPSMRRAGQGGLLQPVSCQVLHKHSDLSLKMGLIFWGLCLYLISKVV